MATVAYFSKLILSTINYAMKAIPMQFRREDPAKQVKRMSISEDHARSKCASIGRLKRRYFSGRIGIGELRNDRHEQQVGFLNISYGKVAKRPLCERSFCIHGH